MSLGYDLTPEQETALELLIDQCGLSAVLQSLSTICGQKAAHIRTTFTDGKALARTWDTAAGAIGLTACHNSVLKIGLP